MKSPRSLQQMPCSCFVILKKQHDTAVTDNGPVSNTESKFSEQHHHPPPPKKKIIVQQLFSI